MENLIILLLVGLMVGAAAGYIWKEKKKGTRCIGCPHSGKCGGSCSGCNSNQM